MNNNKKRENSSKNTTNWGVTVKVVILTGCITFILNQLIASGKDINWTNIIIIAIVGYCSTKATEIVMSTKGKTTKEEEWDVAGIIKHTSKVTKGEEEKPKTTRKPTKKSGQATQENTPIQPEIEPPKRGRGRPRKVKT